MELKDQLIAYLVTNGLNWLLAQLILVFGFCLAKRFGNLIHKLCEKRSTNVTLSRFFVGTSRVLVMGFALYYALKAANITIPFPQRDLHMILENGNSPV